MKFLRSRRPSLRTLLSVTKAKRRVKREFGISQVQAWTEPSRVKQRAKYHVGLYSPVMRAVRQSSKGKVPTPVGLSTKMR